MNALADAAFLSRPEGYMGMPQLQPGEGAAQAAAAQAALGGNYPNLAYSEQEMQAMRARVGMHGHACLSPSEWRAQRRLGH